MRKKLTGGKVQRGKYSYKGKWFFILPQFIWQVIFGWMPVLVTFVIAFQRFYIMKTPTFIGWDNFSSLFQNQLFFTTLKNTFYYAFLSITLTFLVPILVAILLLEMKKGTIRIMMILWFIPISSMASIVLWKWWYDPRIGLLNGILSRLGLPQLMWLNDARLTMICLVIPGLIMYGPGLIYIASLQSIPQALYDAAELEGAGLWKKIWSITIPRIRPIIAMMLILAVIGSMQVFDQPWVMTAGGPGYTTTTIVLWMYKIAFQHLRFGKASTLGLILFFILIALISIQRKYFKENLDE